MSMSGGVVGTAAGAAMAAGRSRVSAEQLELLLSFMEAHPEFAAGKQSLYSRFSSSRLWRLLAERLNAAAADSGARKSPDKWCRYWADIKYKARKKSATNGDLTHAEERLRNIMGAGGNSASGGGGSAREAHVSEEMEDEACSEGSGGAAEGVGGGEGGAETRLSTEELLAEAAMRSALAAEKTAEAAAQGVELLRQLLAVLRPPPPPPPPPPAPHPPPHHPGPHQPQDLPSITVFTHHRM